MSVRTRTALRGGILGAAAGLLLAGPAGMLLSSGMGAGLSWLFSDALDRKLSGL
jgi:hypothetical protein